MITPSFGLTATERVLPRMALDFTTASLDPRVTFTRATSASNPATYINSSGVITAAANNQPRFDFDPTTLVCKGLLIEESRTNALLNSDTLSTQSVTVTATARTLSFYGTGQIVLSGAHSATIAGTGTYPTRTTFTFTPAAGTLTLTVTGTVQFAQLESGTFATSFIPTAGAALTRNADTAVMTGTNFSDWFNASEGALVVEQTYSTPAPAYTVTPIFYASAAPNANFLGTYNINSSGLYAAARVNSGSPIQTSKTVSLSGRCRSALAYKANNSAFTVNGLSTVPLALTSIPVVNSLGLAGVNVAFVQATNAATYLVKVFYYSVRLTNAEIQAFSK